MLRRRKTDPRHAQDQVEEAKKAAESVKKRDEDVKALSSEIIPLVRELRDFQRRNNFVNAIRHALGGEGG